MEPNYLFIAMLLMTAFAAFVRGGRAERSGILIYLAGCAATVWVASPAAHRFSREEVGILIVDLLTFAAFFAHALIADRFWPIWVTALLGVPLFGHLAMLLMPDIVPWAYAFILSIGSYPILVLITLASLQHRRRRPPAPR